MSKNNIFSKIFKPLPELIKEVEQLYDPDNPDHERDIKEAVIIDGELKVEAR